MDDDGNDDIRLLPQASNPQDVGAHGLPGFGIKGRAREHEMTFLCSSSNKGIRPSLMSRPVKSNIGCALTNSVNIMVEEKVALCAPVDGSHSGISSAKTDITLLISSVNWKMRLSEHSLITTTCPTGTS